MHYSDYEQKQMDARFLEREVDAEERAKANRPRPWITVHMTEQEWETAGRPTWEQWKAGKAAELAERAAKKIEAAVAAHRELEAEQGESCMRPRVVLERDEFAAWFSYSLEASGSGIWERSQGALVDFKR